MNCRFGRAAAEWDGTVLRVTTGAVSRTWSRTISGLMTTSFARLSEYGDDVEWIETREDNVCDWEIRGVLDSADDAVCADLRVMTDVLGNETGIVCGLEFRYLAANLGIRYTVFAYPEAPGIRTRLSIRLLDDVPGPTVQGSFENSICERLRIDTRNLERHAAGYYNDSQHRNHDDTPILKQETHSGDIGRREIYDWANLLVLSRFGVGVSGAKSATRNGEGCILVKESHKCVNQPGFDGGAFVVDADEIRVSGLGINNIPYRLYQPEGTHMLGTGYTECWATWSILYTGGLDEASLALKRFDRMRFRPDMRRNLTVRANTWGSRFDPRSGAKDAATGEVIEAEIESCAGLGIELLTIDAGWDSRYPAAGENGADTPLVPHPDRFPGGWAPIRRLADERNILLGLHFDVMTPIEDLISNYEEGGFACYKLDYGSFEIRRHLDEVLLKAWELAERTRGKLQLSWDLTENSPRMGYFLGREYGTLYPENRREASIARVSHVAYIPRLVLRDAWHFAHYLDLGQIEIPIQYPPRMIGEYSNASEYSTGYCVAIALMAVPLFFMETRLYDEEARIDVKGLLSIYKSFRDELCNGYIFPIGEEPDDHSRTGFQSYDPVAGTGILILFREIHNRQATGTYHLRFADVPEMRMSDLLTGDESVVQIDDGSFAIEIADPGSFRIFRYEYRRR